MQSALKSLQPIGPTPTILPDDILYLLINKKTLAARMIETIRELRTKMQHLKKIETLGLERTAIDTAKWEITNVRGVLLELFQQKLSLDAQITAWFEKEYDL